MLHDLAERVLERVDQEEAIADDSSAGSAVTIDRDMMWAGFRRGVRFVRGSPGPTNWLAYPVLVDLLR